MLKLLKKYVVEVGTVAFVLFITTVSIFQVTGVDKAGDLLLLKLAMIGLTFFPISIIISLSARHLKKRRLYTAVAYMIGLITSVAFTLSIGLDNALAITGVELTKYLLVWLVLFVWMFTLPSLFIKDKVDAWRQIQHTVMSFVVAFFSSVVVQIGITLAFAAIMLLFKTTVDNRLVLIVSVWIMFGLNALMFLYGLSREVKPESNSTLNRIMFMFAKYILVPLQVLYTGILYIYFITLFSGKLPSNQLVYLILAFILPGFISLLILYPYRLMPKNRFSKIYYIFYAANLVPMMFVYLRSISLRVYEHGLTTDRAIVFLIGFILSIAIIYVPFKKYFRLDVYALIFGLIIITAFYFPYLNINNVSRMDQQARFEAKLHQYNLIVNNRIAPRELDYMTSSNLRSDFTYIDANYSIEFLKQYLTPTQWTELIEEKGSYNRLYVFSRFIDTEAMDNPIKDTSKQEYFTFNYESRSTGALNISGYSQLINLRSNYNVTISRVENKNTLTVKYQGKDIVVDLGQYVKTVFTKYNKETYEAYFQIKDAADSSVDIPATATTPAMTFVPASITGYYYESKEAFSLNYVEGYLLIK